MNHDILSCSKVARDGWAFYFMLIPPPQKKISVVISWDKTKILNLALQDKSLPTSSASPYTIHSLRFYAPAPQPSSVPCSFLLQP